MQVTSLPDNERKAARPPPPAVTVCEDCGQQYPTVQFGRTCPHCQSPRTHLLQGHEMLIKEIEAVETGPTAPERA